MAPSSWRSGNLTAGDGNVILQGFPNASPDSALERKQFRHGNPPPLNRNFLGREREVAAIKTAFKKYETRQQKRYVIFGMAGIGKSEICVKLLHELHSEFWGLFWIDVSDFASAEGDFKKIADQIRPGTAHESLGDALSALAEVDFNTHPWLLVLDNADELREDYAQFFPSVLGGSILLTSRNHECAVHETVGFCELESISFNDSVLLLLKAARVHQREWESYRPQAETITELLGSHTLTLVQAGAFISRDARNWNEYPRMFQENRQHLLTTSWSQAQSKYGNVYATFEVSARTLESDGSTEAKDALCLLEVFAMFHHSGFPTSIFEQASKGLTYMDTSEYSNIERGGYSNAIDRISIHLANLLPEFLSERQAATLRLRTGLYCLEALSFVTQASMDDQDGARLVSMHPLAHSWAKDRLDQKKQEQAWMMTGSIITLSIKSDPQHSVFWDRSMWELHARQLQPHISSFLDHRVSCRPRIPWPVEHLQVRYNISKLLDVLHLHRDRESFLLEVFHSFKAEPSRPESIDLLSFYKEMADTWLYLEKHQSSIDLWRQIIRLQEANSFHEKEVLDSKYELAAVYRSCGETSKAIAQLESIVSIHEGIYHADHPYILDSQTELGSAYVDNGQTEKAVELLEHVVRIRQRTLEESSLNRLASQHGLGHAYLENGQTEKAIEILEHVVQTLQKWFMKDSLDRLRSEHELGCAYLENGKVEKAIEILGHVVKTRQETLAETSSDRLASEYELGCAYDSAKRHHEAVELFEHVAHIRRKTLPPADPVLLDALMWLLDIYLECQQPEKAKEVVLEFQDAMMNLPKDDARWREHGQWLEYSKQCFGIEGGEHALDELEFGSDAQTDSTDAEYGPINGPDAAPSTNNTQFERQVARNLPYRKRIPIRVLNRAKGKERQ